MSPKHDLERRIADHYTSEAPSRAPGWVLERILASVDTTPQRRTVFGRPWRFPPMISSAKLGLTVVAVVAIAAVGFTFLRQPTVGPEPSAGRAAELGPFEPVASPIACGGPYGVLGCSRDGTRLLVQKFDGSLFVLHADGSETLVAELSGMTIFRGSARPSGATISPDGSRVIFAGLTKIGGACHNGALFAVDADGGPAMVLWKSQGADEGGDGIVRDPAFSPDGTQIAFADGYCDRNHSVWVMNADGSDAHQIVSDANGPLDATSVHSLAWSAAGDRIALMVDEGTYTFATDGSGFTQAADASEFCWPGRRCYPGTLVNDAEAPASP